MIKIIVIILLFVFVYALHKSHVKIKFRTFFDRGYRVSSTPFGIYCYHNKQGSGKTQSAVEYLLENKDKRIYANMKSIKGIHYKYFSGFQTLLYIGMHESDCIIFYDELFKGLVKGSKMTRKEKEDLMDFMSQMRKRNIIFITTAQEWLEIPIEFRRYVRYDIKCKLFSFLNFPILIKEFNDTELIRWSVEDNEYISPRISTIIEHGRKVVVNSYDTFEVISNLNNSPIDMYNEYNENDYIIKNDDIKVINNEKNDIIDNEIVSNFPFSEENSNNESDEKLSNYYTTTNSNSIVNSQYTNILHNNNDIKIIDTSANFDNIDNDFWENFNDTDYDE